MDKVYLRTQLLKNKTILQALVANQNGKEILNKCSDDALNIIIKILFLISSGEIPLRKASHDELKKSLRLKKLESFSSRQFINNLLSSDRGKKQEMLRQFLKVYPILFQHLFERF